MEMWRGKLTGHCQWRNPTVLALSCITADWLSVNTSHMVVSSWKWRQHAVDAPRVVKTNTGKQINHAGQNDGTGFQDIRFKGGSQVTSVSLCKVHLTGSRKSTTDRTLVVIFISHLKDMASSRWNADTDEQMAADSTFATAMNGDLDSDDQRACQERQEVSRESVRKNARVCNDLNGNTRVSIRQDVSVDMTESDVNRIVHAATVAVNSVHSASNTATTVMNTSDVNTDLESVDLTETDCEHHAGDLDMRVGDNVPPPSRGCGNLGSTVSSDRPPAYTEAINAICTPPPKYEDVVPEYRTVVPSHQPQSPRPPRQGYCSSPTWRFTAAGAMLAFIMVVLVVALLYKTRQ